MKAGSSTTTAHLLSLASKKYFSTPKEQIEADKVIVSANDALKVCLEKLEGSFEEPKFVDSVLNVPQFRAPRQPWISLDERAQGC